MSTKFISIIFGACLVVISGVILFLVKNGIALRSAGVIKPTLIGRDGTLIGKSLALRLFPEFQNYKNVIWISQDSSEDTLAAKNIASLTLNHLKKERSKTIPQIINIPSSEPLNTISDSITPRWWLLTKNSQPWLDQFKKENSKDDYIVIYISSFDRNSTVPAECENQKVLNEDCFGFVSVREVQKKLKSEEKYFFMRRYLDNDFYLFIEGT